MIHQKIQHLFVGGEWVDRAASGETFDVTNPATCETIATLSDAGEEDARRAIDAAASAQPAWAGTADTTAGYRAGILQEAARLIREREERLAGVMTLEQGKPPAESRSVAQAPFGGGQGERRR